MTSPWMNIRTAAEYLDLPIERLYKLRQARKIPHYKQDGRLLFNRDELDEWLKSMYAGPEELRPSRPSVIV